MTEETILGFVNELCRRNRFASFIDPQLRKAIIEHDSQILYGTLMHGLSYQGISDRIADGYIRKHGNITYQEIAQALGQGDTQCPKLKCFSTFRKCGYQKDKHTCNL